MKLLTQILIIYSWGVVCVLLLFLYRIARFFDQRLLQKAAGEKRQSTYPLVLLPLLLFAVSAIIYTVTTAGIVGNVAADTLRILGSIILGFTGYSLLNTMMGGRS